MPKLYRIGRYVIFIWSNEINEPIHVHIGVVNPSKNSTKIWLTRSGGCIVANNHSKIPQTDLNDLLVTIQHNFFYICSKWKSHFHTDDIQFYC